MKMKTLDSLRPAGAPAPSGLRLALGLLAAGLTPAFANMNDDPAADAMTTTTTTTATKPTPGDNSRAAAGETSRADRRFLNKAARLGEREVALSRVAGRQATDARVRAFAEEMVREHTKVNDEIAALARRKGVTPETPDATERRAEEKKWTEKKAGDFDKDYLEAMIDAHEDTVDVLENGMESKDPEIAALAARALPSVKAHLARAEALEDGLK
jgi:putative membrane protein